ncbi:hypothetical protein Rctr197k_145 [Virus Rctr197k]|nr:hypothetical protein Rctr197k_145 [Virus Rctr197k]
MTETHVTVLGTCGCCEREVAIEGGRLVHHGYSRPGDGSIHGDCFAVGYEPYERSTAACEAWRSMVEADIPKYEKRLADLGAGRVTYIRRSFGFSAGFAEYAMGVTELHRFQWALEHTQWETSENINAAKKEVARMNRLINDFELRELGTETRAGQKERAAKEARAAERAAKKALRDEKARVLREKKAIKAAKAEALKAKYRAELEAVLEKHEALGSLKAPSVKFEAMDVIARMQKECRKTPKVSFRTRELGWEELFIRLGLAQREDRGWVQYDVYSIG